MITRDEIKEIRTRHDWTQRQLADAIWVDPRTVARWESGETAPHPGMARRLSDLLALSRKSRKGAA